MFPGNDEAVPRESQWRGTSGQGTARLVVLRWPPPDRATHSARPNQTPSRLIFVVELDTLMLKSIQKCKGHRIANSCSERTKLENAICLILRHCKYSHAVG